MDVIKDHLGVKAFCMLLHALHKLRTLHAVVVARPVVHVGGGHQLAALFQTRDHHRVQVGACSVDGRGPAGGAGTQDQ